MAYDTAVIIAYSAISFTMAYLAMNIDRKEHGAIQILFIFLALYGGWALLGAVGGILDLEGADQLIPLNNAYITVQFWATYAILGYVFLMFIWTLKSVIMERKNRRKDELQPSGPGDVRF